MVKPFIPKLVYFEPKALDYPLGQQLLEKFEKMDVEIRYTTSHIKFEIYQEIMISKNTALPNQH